MAMLSSAQLVSNELSSASADLTDDRVSDQHPALRYADDTELDAEWLSAQLGAAVGCSHRIARHLASGGMGHVFVAEHDYLGALAAVKVPRYADATGRNILEAEARLLAKLEHPNIVRAMDVGQLADGRMYLMMEHVAGIELGAWLDAHGPMPFERALTVLAQVASALDYLHRKGIVHGDIKPANLLIDVSANDFVKLLDFGIASNTGSKERRGAFGTPEYMAPEQARGEAWGTACDVYALAALAIQLLTGHALHEHRSAQDVLTAVLSDPAPAPSALGLNVPGLDAVFAKGLHREPAQRYPRASAFVSALAETLRAPARAKPSEPVAVSAATEHRGPSAVSRRLASPWGLVLNDRVLRKLAAGVFAAVYIFSVYG
ncbi:MAG TPA: serine/threonine-protein kinase [Polyangiales bacterium]|nr:serine/threonine-protein kinase [Polyangiales bacterium]